MQETKGKVERAIKGIDQQDFDEFQLVKGTFPYQVGLQQRIPGKTIQRVLDGPIGSIYVFYMVYGRTYTIVDFTTLQIDEIIEPPITNPFFPPVGTEWTETFSGYTTGLISKFWGAGIWPITTGVCESIIEGVIDPFYVTEFAPAPDIPIEDQPRIETTPGSNITPADKTNPKVTYPLEQPDIILRLVLAQADYSCYGQGTNAANAYDLIHYYDYSGGNLVSTYSVISATIGGVVNFGGINIGRLPDKDIGIVRNENGPDGSFHQCGGPPQPVPTIYFVNLNNGQFGQES